MRTGLFLLGFAVLSAAAARADEPCKPVNPCEIPEGALAPTAPLETPADFAAEARQLFGLLSCEGSAPAGLDAAQAKAFCAQAAKRAAKAKAARAAIQAALPKPAPEKVPPVVVYPLSGGDLLGALTAFPDARNYTLTARAPAGDPRPASLREPARLAAFLAAATATGGDAGPSLPRLLLALAEDGDEPLGLRYFRVEAGGALHFYGPNELAAAGEAGFANCELLFARRSDPTRQRVVRLLAADPGDAAAPKAPGTLAHLASKGTFAAMLPSPDALAASGYTKLRELFEKRAAVVVARRP